MTPCVCDQPRSCGLPMAKTVSPTFIGRPFCQGAAWASDASEQCTRTRARSIRGRGHPDDLPLDVGLAEDADGQAADAREPSRRLLSLSEGKSWSTTWRLVTIRASPRSIRRITPDPIALPPSRAIPMGPLDQDVGPHGALQGRLELLDRREVRRRIGEDRVG